MKSKINIKKTPYVMRLFSNERGDWDVIGKVLKIDERNHVHYKVILARSDITLPPGQITSFMPRPSNKDYYRFITKDEMMVELL